MPDNMIDFDRQIDPPECYEDVHKEITQGEIRDELVGMLEYGDNLIFERIERTLTGVGVDIRRPGEDTAERHFIVII